MGIALIKLKGVDLLRNKILKNSDKLMAIKIWNQRFHPLTCGNDGCREILEGIIQEGEVILKCKCGYVQKNVPTVIYDNYERVLQGKV